MVLKPSISQEETHSVTHGNAPLTVLGRQRAVALVIERDRLIAHVAAEFHIARATISKWVGRYRAGGASGLEDRSSVPVNRSSRLRTKGVELIEHLRRMKKWSARRIARELTDGNHAHCTVRTVTRWLDRLGLDRIRDVTADGEYLRRPGKVSARYPGHMVHMDVKKVGKIPDGGGWWAQGRGSEKALAGKRAHKQKVGYTYLHSIEDEFSRLAYTEALEDETAATTIAFFHRARVFFAAHGITRISRLVTDNGSNYTARAFRRSTCAFIGRHQRTRIYTPRHNGKIERYQRLMTDECLYARAYDSEAERRDAIGVWNHHYTYHRPHTACGDQPPASRLHASVDNVMTNYT